MKQVFLSIVIPAYNEETNIRLGALDKVFRYLDTVLYTWEVIVVDDGSSDGTRKLLEEFRSAKVTIIHNSHQGKAATVITGVLAARGEIVLFTDLDQAAPIREVGKLLPWFEQGYDVVIGSRNARREGAPFLRLIMARGFMMLRSILLGLGGIRDTQCGFKAFKKRSARNIFQRLKLYGERHQVSGSMVTAGFDIEVLFLARSMGYQIKEVPIEWHYVETRRVNPIKDSWQGFCDIVRIRVNAQRGLYTK